MINVFQFLGLTSGHRKPDNTVQKVKNIEEVPESKKEWPMYAQAKKDGVYGMVVHDGLSPAMFGRTGKMLSSCEHLLDQYEKLPAGVYIGEIVFPDYSLEVLSGIVNPNRKKPLDDDLYIDWKDHGGVFFHDHLTLEEFLNGESSRPYTTRFRSLCDHGLPVLAFSVVASPDSAEYCAVQLIEQGEEGAVFKQNVGWEAGHKGWRMMKRVRHIEYDLLCVGAEEGTGKYKGKVVNLIFRWRNGGTIKAMLGKGWTHEDARRMWTNYHDTPEGLTYRVYGLQDSSKGKIRLPKVGEARIDKETPDY